MNIVSDVVRCERDISRIQYRFRMRERAKAELHPMQVPLLAELTEGDGCSQTALSARMMVAPATVAVSLRRLEKAGLVERKPDPDDGRTMLVYLTDCGRRAHECAYNAFLRIVRKKFEGFSEQELKAYYSFLMRIKANLEREKERTHD